MRLLPRRESPPGGESAMGKTPAEAGSGRGGGPDLEALERRLAEIERRLDDELAGLRRGAVRRSNPPAEREDIVGAIRDFDDRLVEIANRTSHLARGQRRGLFRGARNVAKLAGELVTPDYYSRKLAEFGLRDRSVRVDEFGMDPAYRASIRPFMEFLFRRWWRVRIEGISNIPERGAALLVGNHAGVIPYDAAMVSFGVEMRHPARRRVRFLIEDWFSTLPFASPLIARAGAVRANRENAERLLRTGHLVGAFPEGTKGSLKYYKDRYKVQRFGRGGSVRLAMRTGVPIIPFAVVGSEEIYPVLAKANLLARAVGLGELPIAANTLLGPLGLIPLPSKWIIRIGKPIDVARRGARGAENDILVNKIANELRENVQEMVDDLLTRRKSAWRG
ncbi:MAG: lysophospholipid acyltransferase family protein [Deltaproteobacteria bacterium]|nr:lysophospholipid acyltransferase family protein [Deltaproteobacteria bacterium]